MQEKPSKQPQQINSGEIKKSDNINAKQRLNLLGVNQKIQIKDKDQESSQEKAMQLQVQNLKSADQPEVRIDSQKSMKSGADSQESYQLNIETDARKVDFPYNLSKCSTIRQNTGATANLSSSDKMEFQQFENSVFHTEYSDSDLSEEESTQKLNQKITQK